MLHTPYYLIDKAHLLPNLEKIAYLREASGRQGAAGAEMLSPHGRSST
jgi:carboxynorspermidine decarboxylase